MIMAYKKILVTGSSGHLGEALVRTLKTGHYEVSGLDILESPFTTHTGSITNRSFVKACLDGIKTVIHTATLHKPHVGTHSLQEFVDTNISGTLNLLQESVAAGVENFIFTSTTSVFGDALVPPPGLPAAWITEEIIPQPKNIYGVTKAAAEDLCQLFYRNYGLPCIVLRTSRFFPEEDDNKEMRGLYSDENLKANEYLSRRVEIEDAVNAHLLAVERAGSIGFSKYIISATTPFSKNDMTGLRNNPTEVLDKIIPEYKQQYQRLGWRMFPGIDRVYVNEKARKELGWKPLYDFKYIVNRLKEGTTIQSTLAKQIGSKGYHAEEFSEGPYPTE